MFLIISFISFKATIKKRSFKRKTKNSYEIHLIKEMEVIEFFGACNIISLTKIFKDAFKNFTVTMKK